MLPFPVVPQGDFLRGVEHLNVFKAGGLHVSMGGVTNAMNPFELPSIFRLPAKCTMLPILAS